MLKKLLLYVTAIGFLVGCSTPESRIREHPEVFSSLPERQQIAVKEGEITQGMSKEAVILALGEPDHVIQGRDNGVVNEYWVYTRTEPALTGYYSSRVFWPSYYSGPYYAYREVPVQEIKFENGRVTYWSEVVG